MVVDAASKSHCETPPGLKAVKGYYSLFCLSSFILWPSVQSATIPQVPGIDPQVDSKSADLEPDSAFFGVWQEVPGKGGKPGSTPVRRIRVDDKGDGLAFSWSDSTDSKSEGTTTIYGRSPGKTYPKIYRAKMVEKGVGQMMISRQEGIYRLENDTFTIAWGAKLPTDFHSGQGRIIEVYRRVRQPEQAAFLRGKWDLVSLTRDGVLQSTSKRSLVVGQSDEWAEHDGLREFSIRAVRSEGIPWPSIRLERKSEPSGKTAVRNALYKLDRKKGELTLRYGGGPLDDMEPGPGKTIEIYRLSR